MQWVGCKIFSRQMKRCAASGVVMGQTRGQVCDGYHSKRIPRKGSERVSIIRYICGA
jgi:hypothetical protein